MHQTPTSETEIQDDSMKTKCRNYNFECVWHGWSYVIPEMGPAFCVCAIWNQGFSYFLSNHFPVRQQLKFWRMCVTCQQMCQWNNEQAELPLRHQETADTTWDESQLKSPDSFLSFEHVAWRWMCSIFHLLAPTRFLCPIVLALCIWLLCSIYPISCFPQSGHSPPSFVYT